MIVFICSGGPSEQICSLEAYKTMKNVYFIGADKGALTLYENGIVPNAIIGDFDSIDKESLTKLKKIVPVVLKAEVEKDETDTDLALDYALTLEPSEIILTGVSGGRLDHEEAAKRSLLRVQLQKPEMHIKIMSKQNSMEFFVKANEWVTFTSPYKYVSFFAANESIREVTLRGVKYETTNEPMDFCSARFTSNEIVAEKGHILFSNGICLMITSAD